MDYSKISEICTTYNIRNYSINQDGFVDVDGNINLFRRNLTEFPLHFGQVSGNFNCVDNKLTTLIGSPKYVGGDFDCSHNLISSLIGSPAHVGGDYCIGANELLDLTGCPNFIGRHLYIEGSMMSTYSGEVDMEIDGFVYLNASHLYEEYMLGNSYVQRNLPLPILENIKNIATIIKYQRYFEIWNKDLTLNEENFNDFIDEIKEGLK